MGTLLTNPHGLADIAAMYDNPNLLMMAETMRKHNAIIEDMQWKMCNKGTQHSGNKRVSLPTTYDRQLNLGVAASKGEFVPVLANTKIREAWSEIDEEVMKLIAPEQRAAYRIAHMQSYIQALTNAAVTEIFYGNPASDGASSLTGLSVMDEYSGASDTQVIDGGNDTDSDCMSLWVIAFDFNQFHGIYPMGHAPMIQHDDLGLVVSKDSSNRNMRQWTDKFQFSYGIFPQWTAYAVRIANVDIVYGQTADLDPDDFVDAKMKLPVEARDSAKIYCNETGYAQILKSARTEVTPNAYQNAFHQDVPSIYGMPIRICQSLVTENDIT